MELFHLAHSDGAACSQERVAAEGNVEDVLHGLAHLVWILWIRLREDNHNEDSAHRQQDHQDFKAFDSLFQNEKGQD